MQINLQEVRFSYSNDKSLIKKGIYNLYVDSLTIDKPELICMVGHTGSGKSTLAQILNCLYTPQSGKLTIDDCLVGPKTKLTPIRKKVGLVFQFPEYQLFEDTTLKDVEFGPKNFGLDEPNKRAVEALKQLKILDLADATPFALSGGQMRKIAIAGIIASDPDILIMDEPTAGLDSKAKKELIELLLELVKKGKTVIIITHDMDIVNEYASRVIVMKKGHLVYDGDPKELFSDEDRLNEFNLGLPSLHKLIKELNNELGTNYDTNVRSVSEVIKLLGEKYE